MMMNPSIVHYKHLTFKSEDGSPSVPHRGLQLGGSVAEDGM